MGKPATILPAGTLTAILLCAVATSAVTVRAFAQDAASIPIEQVSLGDVFSTQSISVVQVPFSGGPDVWASGNSVAAGGFGGPAAFQTSQDLNAEVAAQAMATAGDAQDASITVNAGAIGNVAKQAACCAATSAQTTQTIEGYHDVSTSAALTIGGSASDVAVNSVAVGNAETTWVGGGSATISTNQDHFGTTSAATTASTDTVVGQAAYSAVAVANTSRVTASVDQLDQSLQQQTSGYQTDASVVAAQSQGSDVAAAAAAAANLSDANVQTGDAKLSADQSSDKPVTASADLTVQSWTGSAIASASGVGDGQTVATGGSSSTLMSSQSNQGAITATANFTGGAGGEGAASATGVGNAYYGVVCGSCSGAARASLSQINGGSVQSAASVNGGSMGAAVGSSSAAGNSAAVIVQKSGG